MSAQLSSIIDFISGLYPNKDFIALHEPSFSQLEKDLVLRTIESTFVSSVGEYVDEFEHKLSERLAAPVIVVNSGTSALHMALVLSGVGRDDKVITQALTFVATCNAIAYCGAEPVLLDVDLGTLGLSADVLADYLANHTYQDESGVCRDNTDHKAIRACVPMHTFGLSCDIVKIAALCEQYHIELIEDAAEALGSSSWQKPLGTFGRFGVLSFNGNKTITTGAGGAIICRTAEDAKRAKFLTTTAKQADAFEYYHPELGYNYRMPNLNAALGVAQLAKLDDILASKQAIAQQYQHFFKDSEFKFISAPANTVANNWLNAVLAPSKEAKQALLEFAKQHNVMMRPAWQPMYRLPMYQDVYQSKMANTEYLIDHLVNLPSSAQLGVPTC
ncbi:LegC family aminotransferase [Pseudoalteromonas tunicata]|uniref:LegC family aminotransferase n=1 Tax=Pseudoalteromonas tunicata TaxID=314281 RepID=UPI00273D11AF|nr:LegC family aminotransferase [Pseudoalteromonas tunicata]MDP5212461.1 LegC family aminotransferase [Pseudoalteromonas tunicata]